MATDAGTSSARGFSSNSRSLRSIDWTTMPHVPRWTPAEEVDARMSDRSRERAVAGSEGGGVAGGGGVAAGGAAIDAGAAAAGGAAGDVCGGVLAQAPRNAKCQMQNAKATRCRAVVPQSCRLQPGPPASVCPFCIWRLAFCLTPPGLLREARPTLLHSLLDGVYSLHHLVKRHGIHCRRTRFVAAAGDDHWARAGEGHGFHLV